MAFSAILTGTGRNCNITSGQSTIVVSSATGLIVGATIQGTGIPTGTRIGSINGTTITMVNASGAAVTATATNATASLIFSSVYGSVLTISLSASGDTATPLNIYSAGFGVMSDNIAKKEIFFPGGLTVTWANIVSGAVFDFGNWTLEFGDGGRWRFQESSIVGELRGGYLVNGTQFIKTVGPTFYCFNWNNGSAGGSSMFENVSGTTNQGLFRMHNMRVVEISGSNAAPTFYSSRMTMVVENLILDYQADSAGANAGIGAAFGTLKNTYLVKTNAGIGATNGTNFATFDGIQYVGNYQSSPQHKFSMPNGYTLDGYAPQVLSTQFLGGFNSATSEIYSNINLSSAGWGLDDLKTKYQRYGGPITLQFPRRVSLQFNDSTGTDLTGVTLYIKSGSTALINAVQGGDYSANVQALNLVWTANVASYRVCNSFVDTIDQIAQVRKYGKIENSTNYSLNLASYSQPFFLLDDTSLTGIDEATASAITTAGINWSTKTITPTADLTYDQINARIAWELAQTTNSDKVDPRSITGRNLTLATGWTLVVNTGRTISAGTNITQWYTPTITINGTGKIDAVYQTTVGTSTILEFGSTGEPIIAGTSLAIYDASGVTQYYNAVTSNGVYRYYIPPQATGATYTYAIERYGYKREEGTFMSNNGGIIGYVPNYSEDVGITEATLATVQAYTILDDTAKIYDATANFRLSETGIKLGQLVARDGTYLDFGTFNVKIKDDNASIISVASSTITYKSIVVNETTKYNAMKSTPPATITPTDTELINVLIEDANGDSQINILGGLAPFNIYKFPIATTDFPIGTIPDTRTDISNFVESTSERNYRFIADPAYNYFVYSPSIRSDSNIPINFEGQTDWEVLEKGIYSAPLYKGDEIIIKEAPEITQINQKMDEVIVKIDTNLDTKISTRLADADYTAPHNSEIDAIKAVTDTLVNYDDTILINKIDTIQNDLDVNFSGITTDLNIINTGVQDASIFIPHDTNL